MNSQNNLFLGFEFQTDTSYVYSYDTSLKLIWWLFVSLAMLVNMIWTIIFCRTNTMLAFWTVYNDIFKFSTYSSCRNKNTCYLTYVNFITDVKCFNTHIYMKTQFLQTNKTRHYLWKENAWVEGGIRDGVGAN